MRRKMEVIVRSVLLLLEDYYERNLRRQHTKGGIMEKDQDYSYSPYISGSEYYNIERRSEIREGSRKLRRQYLRYKEAEIIYSMSHKKLLELAGKAGAIVRIDATVLIDRELFDEYLEQFREESTLKSGKRYAR